MFKKLKIDKKMFLNADFKREAINETERTVQVSFASEVPYLRWFGYEIIDTATMDLSRLNNSAQLLFNHDWDCYIGVVEKAWVENKVGYAIVRFDTHEKAEQIFNSVKSGIIKNMSFGYEITDAWEVLNLLDDGEDSYKVSTIPFEISFVTVPADPSIGYGRLKDKDIEEIEIDIKDNKEEKIKILNYLKEKSLSRSLNEKELKKLNQCKEDYEDEEDGCGLGDNQEDDIEDEEEIKEKNTDQNTDLNEKEEKSKNILENSNKKVDIEKDLLNNKENHTNDKTINILNMEKTKMERNEIDKKIKEIAKQYNATDLAMDFIGEKSVEDFQNALLEIRSSKPSKIDTEVAEFEKDGFSLGLAMKQMMNGEISGSVKEVSKEMERKYGGKRAENSILIPFGALKRDVTVGTSSSAGALKPTSLSMNSIEALYNNLVIVKAGASYMNDLVGDIDIPRFDNIAAAQYVGENAAASGSSLDVDLVRLSGKDLTANIEVSRRIRMQTPYNIEQICSEQLLQAISHKMDLDALTGDGSGNSVKGILHQTGIGSVATGGTLSWQDLLDLESEVLYQNALINKGSYITNSKVLSLMKGTQKANALNFLYENGTANEYPVLTTNGLTEVGTTTKTSPLFFGDFSQLLVGTWGAIELQFNPYANTKTGLHSLTVFVTFDTVVRHPQSFSVATDIITTSA